MLDRAERRHRPLRDAWEPPANVYARGGELRVVVALPGAASGDIAVQLTPSGLQIDAVVPPPATPDGAQLLRLEIPWGRMRRSVELPHGRYRLRDSVIDRGCLHVQLERLLP